MAGLFGYASQAELNWIAGNPGVFTPSARFLALFTAIGTDANASGFTEVSGTGYARVQIAGQAVTNGATASGNGTIHIAAVPAWLQAALSTLVAAGVGVTVTDITTPSAIPTGTTLTAAGTTTLTMSANAAGAGIGSGDTLNFSIFPLASGSSPAAIASGAGVPFAQATASWGTAIAWGILDALTAGNPIAWDFLGADPWYAFDCTNASPGVLTANGITAGSAPALANGAAVVVTNKLVGSDLPAGMSNYTIGTVAGLSADSFNMGVNTTSVGSGLVRQYTQQVIPANVTYNAAAGAVALNAA